MNLTNKKRGRGEGKENPQNDDFREELEEKEMALGKRMETENCIKGKKERKFVKMFSQLRQLY